MMRSLRIATAVACALSLACLPASAQVIGSGHVLGNGTSSPAAPTDTPLLNVMQQSGSGISFAGNTTKLATVTGTIPNGHCRSTDASGNDIDAGGACTVGGGGGTVASATIPTTVSKLPPPLAVYSGSPGSASTTVAGLSIVPPGNGGAVCANLEEFGGAGDGSTNNATPMNNLLAAFSSNTNGGCLVEGAGHFDFGSAIAYNYPTGSGNPTWSVSISGAGADTTIFDWAAGGGLAFGISSFNHTFHVSNLTLMTGAVNTGAGLNVVFSNPSQGPNSFSDVRGVTFRGETSSDYWANGFADTGVSFINFDGDFFIGSGGNGISLAGSTGATFPYAIIFNIDKSNFGGLTNAFIYGNKVQGVTIDKTNFTNGSIAILVPSSETGLDQLTISNSQFNETGNAIEILSAVPFQFDNDLFIVGSSSAVLCQLCSLGNISNSQITALTTGTGTGVDVAADSAPGVVFTGNALTGLAAGIVCASGTYCNLQSNIYASNTNKSSPGSTTGNVTIGGGTQ